MNRKYLTKQNIIQYLEITIGTLIVAFAVKNIYAHVNLVTGGVSGLAVVFNNILAIPLWLTNTVINIFLFVAGAKLLGWKYISKTVYATLMLSFGLYIIPEIKMFDNDMILSTVFGGICTGVGIGLTLKNGTSTGGTDMLAQLLHLKIKSRSVVEIMQVLDTAVVIVGIVVFGIKPAMYALITVFIFTKVSDNIIEGVNFSKQIFVISDMAEEIAQGIMTKMNRGVTSIDVKGMYSGANKKMLFCVVRKKELVAFKKIVSSIDKNAFVILSDSREVFGEGFIEKLE